MTQRPSTGTFRHAWHLAVLLATACSRDSNAAKETPSEHAVAKATASQERGTKGPSAANCDACEIAKCPTHRKYCEGFSGQQRAACERVVACVRRTSCHSAGNTLDCYCGKADAAECLRPGGANGACKSDIEAGQGTTAPDMVQARYDDVQFPAGAALSYMLCDAVVCKADCVPYGSR
jgi:hypothetical protein